jgi:hypothetical protein
MKNYLILAMILIAGTTAYPQATRSARESKSEKGSAKKETVKRSSTRSESKANRTATFERSKPATNRSETIRPKAESRSNDRQATRSKETIRPRVDNRNNDRQATRSNNEATRSNPVKSRVDQTNSDRGNDKINNNRSEGSTVTRPDNRSGSTGTARQNENADDRNFRINTSSASRVYREGKGTLTRDDGTVQHHQNDEVFTSRKHKLDFDNYENLRRSDEFRRDYRDYDDWFHHRTIRVVNHYHNRYIPVPWEIRRTRYYYRHPVHLDLIWTPLLFHRFMYYYPTHNNWDMEFGSQIETISAYEAKDYAGTVRRVYGKVDDVYYSPEDENYILYIGAPFPYQDISIVVPKNVARNISMSPKWYFDKEFIWVVGLINVWEGKPEIIVRDEEQIRKY